MEKENNAYKDLSSLNNGVREEISAITDNSKVKPFFISEGVNSRKNQTLKIRCESAITSTGLSNQQFYLKVGISRQQWYYWSWGIEHFPIWLKVKLCDLFGKSFRDLFLGMEEEEK